MNNLMVNANPTLLDYIKVIARADEDQQEHFRAISGLEWDIDALAINNWSAPGPKWCIYRGTIPLCVGGFVPQRSGVFRDYFIFVPEAFQRENWFPLTRIIRRIMDAMLTIAHRLECITPARRLASRPELEKWYTVLGYKREGVHLGYCADKYDAVSFARVK